MKNTAYVLFAMLVILSLPTPAAAEKTLPYTPPHTLLGYEAFLTNLADTDNSDWDAHQIRELRTIFAEDDMKFSSASAETDLISDFNHGPQTPAAAKKEGEILSSVVHQDGLSPAENDEFSRTLEGSRTLNPAQLDKAAQILVNLQNKKKNLTSSQTNS